MSNQLYHASTKQGLTKLQPTKSTHDKKWVYACKDKVDAAIFLSRKGGDFTCSNGHLNGKRYTCERFKGALQYKYGRVSGSIYQVNGDSFKEGKTGWDKELVSTKPVKVTREETIPDALKYLLNLEKEGLLKIYRFPDRPKEVPKDDSDLLKRVRLWKKTLGPKIVEKFKRYHPHLIAKI